MNTIWNTGKMALGGGWLSLLAGVWLIISPFALHFSDVKAGVVNNIVLGILMILVTLGSSRNGMLRGLIVLIGGWLYASAVLLPVPHGSFLWNNLLVGVVAIISMVTSEQPYPSNYKVPGK